jgi:glycosyltransferase involved in cell wall biosynthesis
VPNLLIAQHAGYFSAGIAGLESMRETKNIRLSICIPTLNRGSFIGETLESILSQSTDEVEIVIVDGGSTDNTQEVVCSYQLRFSRLRYIRDGEDTTSDPPVPSAGGFDRDCNRAVELAQGEYCWLFTDDDLLKPGAVERVLNATRKEFGLIVVNAEVRSDDLSEVLDPAKLRLAADRTYEPSESQRLFTDVCDYLSFVGGVVIKRQLWIARQKEHYIGSGFIHVGMVFQSPVPEQMLVIAEPLITVRYGNALYMCSPRYFEIWMFTWPNLIWSFPHFSDAAKRQVCRREPWRKKSILLIYRAIGAFSTREYFEWLEARINSRLERFTSKLIASFPGRAANLLGIVYYNISGRQHSQRFLDLVKSPFYFGRVFKGPRSPQN